MIPFFEMRDRRRDIAFLYRTSPTIRYPCGFVTIIPETYEKSKANDEQDPTVVDNDRKFVFSRSTYITFLDLFHIFERTTYYTALSISKAPVHETLPDPSIVHPREHFAIVDDSRMYESRIVLSCLTFRS